jgi:hypothetical protein
MQPSRVDANQREIVATFRGMGCTVQHLHAVGHGVPDLLVGVRGVNLLVEIKHEDGKLNAVQEAWHEAWRGQAVIVRTSEHAAELVQSVWANTAGPVRPTRWHKFKSEQT